MLSRSHFPRAWRSARRNSLTLWQWMQPRCDFAAAKSSARVGFPASGRRLWRRLVGFERALQRVAQPLQGEPGFGVGGVATAVAAVDRLIGVEEEANHVRS